MAAGDSLSGVDGSVTTPAYGVPQNTVDVHVFAWDGTLDRDVVGDSNFDDATNWKTKLGGMYHMTGTFQGTLVGTGVPLVGRPLGIADFGTKNAQPLASMILQVETGGTYTFAAILSNLNTRVVKTETRGAIITGTFESDGDVVVAP